MRIDKPEQSRLLRLKFGQHPRVIFISILLLVVFTTGILTLFARKEIKAYANQHGYKTINADAGITINTNTTGNINLFIR